MATRIEAAVAAELGNYIDDLTELDARLADDDGELGTDYSDTSQQTADGTILPPNQFHVVLANGQRLLVIVTQAGRS